MSFGIQISLQSPPISQTKSAKSAKSSPNQTPNIHNPSTGSPWWSPLFDWAAQPDYINSGQTSPENPKSPDPAKDRRKNSPRIFVGLTEEKARELRRRILETETFHDAMYHSAIASRLASDLDRGSRFRKWD